MKAKIDNLLYGYNPKAFFPIMSGGKLLNRGQYLTYKISRLAKLQLV